MRVLHIFTNPHLTNGASIFEYRISQKLKKYDIFFDYLITDSATEDEVRRYAEEGSNLYKLSIDNNHGLLVRELKINFEYYKFFKNHSYDIVYADTENGLRAIHLLMARLAGVKTRVVHSHNSSLQTQSKSARKISRLLRHFFLFSATNYFACSDMAAGWLFPDSIFRKGQYQLINNGIDLDQFKFRNEIREKRRSELNVSENTLLIGAVARFMEQKNHSYMLQIFQDVLNLQPNSKLLLIGEGKLEDKVRDEADRMGLLEGVIFFGTTAFVNEYLWAMDVYLMPSLFEGLPITGIEAQAAGLPCFMSDTITQEVGVSELAYYLSIKDKASVWAHEILKVAIYKERLDVSEKVINAGFSIKQTEAYLREFYLSKERTKC